MNEKQNIINKQDSINSEKKKKNVDELFNSGLKDFEIDINQNISK